MPVGIEAVQEELLARHLYGGFGDIDAGDTRFAAGQRGIDRKCAGVAEAVQHVFRARVFAQRLAFVTLVEKKACFLPLPGVNKK